MGIQIIDEQPRRQTTGQRFGQAFGNIGANLGQNIGQALTGQQSQKADRAKRLQTAQSINSLTGLNLTGDEDPELLKAILPQIFKTQGKEKLQLQQQDYLDNLFKDSKGQSQSQSRGRALSLGNEVPNQAIGMMEEGEGQSPQGEDGGFNHLFSNENILKTTIMNPALGRAVQGINDVNQREQTAEKKYNRDVYEGDREYHRKGSEDYEKQIHALKDATETQQNALNLARSSIEDNNPGMFSADNLAQITGNPYWTTVKGAQFGIAAKTNLAANISKQTAKAQNRWFEQVLSKAFAQVGGNREANLAAQEALEGEMLINQAKVAAYDRVTEQQEGKYGYGRKGRDREVTLMTRAKNKEIVNRTAYRTQELFEQEQGINTAQVGKKVPHGKPLTFKMAQLYKARYGDKAASEAKKNGYSVPTAEEYKLYKLSPTEYAETINF